MVVHSGHFESVNIDFVLDVQYADGGASLLWPPLLIPLLILLLLLL